MAEIWETVRTVIIAIFDFLDWYIEDTPLFEDTLTALYNLGIQAYNILIPLLGEYVQLINEYIHGGA